MKPEWGTHPSLMTPLETLQVLRFATSYPQKDEILLSNSTSFYTALQQQFPAIPNAALFAFFSERFVQQKDDAKARNIEAQELSSVSHKDDAEEASVTDEALQPNEVEYPLRSPSAAPRSPSPATSRSPSPAASRSPSPTASRSPSPAPPPPKKLRRPRSTTPEAEDTESDTTATAAVQIKTPSGRTLRSNAPVALSEPRRLRSSSINNK